MNNNFTCHFGMYASSGLRCANIAAHFYYWPNTPRQPGFTDHVCFCHDHVLDNESNQISIEEYIIVSVLNS